MRYRSGNYTAKRIVNKLAQDRSGNCTSVQVCRTKGAIGGEGMWCYMFMIPVYALTSLLAYHQFSCLLAYELSADLKHLALELYSVQIHLAALHDNKH